MQGEPDALVVSEFYGDSPQEVADKVEKLEASLRRQKWGYAYSPALTAQAQADVWKMRKAGLGILMGTREARKPVAFVEDTAVDPAKLPAFLRRFRQITPTTTPPPAITAIPASVVCTSGPASISRTRTASTRWSP